MGGYLEAGDTETCLEYLGKLTKTVDSMGDLIRSGNGVLDYLINSKLSSRKDVRVIVDGSVASFNHIDPVDLSCMVGNVLDNALEAVELLPPEERRIELHFARHNDYSLIVCKNTVKNKVLEGGRLKKSTKKDPDAHGLGHKIVESTAQKYGGWVEYFEESGLFGVQITLS